MTQLRCFNPERNEDPMIPGGLLQELEARQDDVLSQLDSLNAKVEAVLLQLGIRLDEPSDHSFAILGGEEH